MTIYFANGLKIAQQTFPEKIEPIFVVTIYGKTSKTKTQKDISNIYD